MNKWLLSVALIVVTTFTIFKSVSVLFITYAPMIAPNITYEPGNELSIESAIVFAQSQTTERLRELHGSSMLYISVIAVINAFIAIYFIFKANRSAKNT